MSLDGWTEDEAAVALRRLERIERTCGLLLAAVVAWKLQGLQESERTEFLEAMDRIDRDLGREWDKGEDQTGRFSF